MYLVGLPFGRAVLDRGSFRPWDPRHESEARVAAEAHGRGAREWVSGDGMGVGRLGWSGAVEDDCGRGAWESTIAEAAATMVSTPMAVPVDLARLESLQRLVRKRSRGSEDEGGEVSFDAWFHHDGEKRAR